MFRNQYDTDVTVFSPQGRLHQVEYAMEAVNQGTVVLGLRSATHVVLGAVKRQPNDLAAHQQKIHKIDDNLGVGTSGLTADGRSIVKHMRTEALNHRYVYGTQIQGNRLALDLADMHQRCTQSYVRRPYGVGLLIAAYDQTGPHLYFTEPSGSYFEYVAMTMGSRSQTSKTYLEKEFENFDAATPADLIRHALKALSVSLSGDSSLDAKSAAISIVGAGEPFRIIEGDELQGYLDQIAVDGDGDVDMDVIVTNPEA